MRTAFSTGLDLMLGGCGFYSVIYASTHLSLWVWSVAVLPLLVGVVSNWLVLCACYTLDLYLDMVAKKIRSLFKKSVLEGDKLLCEVCSACHTARYLIAGCG